MAAEGAVGGPRTRWGLAGRQCWKHTAAPRPPRHWPALTLARLVVFFVFFFFIFYLVFVVFITLPQADSCYEAAVTL